MGREINFKKWLNESQIGITLGQVALVGTNMEDADFWLQRKGSEETVGKVIRTPQGPNFIKENIGIKVRQEWQQRILPQYLSYKMEYVWMKGTWRAHATGTTRLVSIRSEDVRQLPLD